MKNKYHTEELVMRNQLANLGTLIQFGGTVQGFDFGTPGKKLVLIAPISVQSYGNPETVIELDHLWVQLNLCTPREESQMTDTLETNLGQYFQGVATLHRYQRRNNTQDYSLKVRPFYVPDYVRISDLVFRLFHKKDLRAGRQLKEESQHCLRMLHQKVLLLERDTTYEETEKYLRDFICWADRGAQIIRQKRSRRRSHRFLREVAIA